MSQFAAEKSILSTAGVLSANDPSCVASKRWFLAATGREKDED
jgi:hypothetical protein